MRLGASRFGSVNGASIHGVVIDAAAGKPVSGAQVSVQEDINGDSVIEFAETYTITVTRGNWSYHVQILVVGGQTVIVKQTHESKVGQLQGIGEKIDATPTIGGQLFVVSSANQGPRRPRRSSRRAPPSPVRSCPSPAPRWPGQMIDQGTGEFQTAENGEKKGSSPRFVQELGFPGPDLPVRGAGKPAP